MKNILATIFSVLGVLAMAHETVSVDNVSFNDEGNLHFTIVNHTRTHFPELLVEISFPGGVDGIYLDLSGKSSLEYVHDFSLQSNSTRKPSFGLEDINITIYSDPILKSLLTSWSQKQVNTLYSEFYADAPWRMPKFDENGNENGIPVHFFLHDADLDPIQDVMVDNINIKIKNATDLSFGPVLTYDSWNAVDYMSLFSCYSPFDADLDIKEFSLSSFVPSSSQTIDFNIDSDFWGDYVNVSNKYWYFTFNIPAVELLGMEDVIDVLVQIEYANITFTDDWIGMRVFRTTEDLPSLPGYYRGDTHLHSMYTQNDAEIGLPLCSTKEAAKHIGLDWITTTDHTSDFDNYGVSVPANWNRIRSEAQNLNSLDSSMIYIAGQEVASNNSISNLVHMLAYPSHEDPFSLPFIGDAQGDVFPTSVTTLSALNAINGTNGFAYAAHPFATSDELPSIPVDGGIWNVGSANFPDNSSSFPLTGGSIICNDPTVGSDVLSDDTMKIVKDGLVGAQIWNSRKTISSTDDELDAWDVQNQGGGFSPSDTSSYGFHIKRFRQGQEIVNHVNQLGLKLKNQNELAENWKLYFSAGSDAHGSFNYSNTDDFAGLGSISNNAVGKLMTIVSCPNGMGENGSNVLYGLRNGMTTLSDGPILTIGISSNGDNFPEAIMGETAILDENTPSDDDLILEYSNTSEFGEIIDIRLILGTEDGESSMNIPVQGTTGTFSFTNNLTSITTSLNGGNPLNNGEYYYLRAELMSERDYDTNSVIYKLNSDRFHSFTNPVWISYKDVTGVNEIVNSFNIYPNPTNDYLHIEFSGFLVERDIIIQDQTGRMVLKCLVKQNADVIDVSQLAPGYYSMIINEESGVMYNTKFIKQ